ncbi:unnamed protein product [Aspergillus oryzae var. brunneus]|uniref:Unnamed protein product n=1 Tax=Aspergillus oryzae var. brunneus TaxID=332754 RepID=A0ABQ6KNP4_ASPOZ|nr:unnamed protein product [Aspergillus oryzae var. brunneus]
MVKMKVDSRLSDITAICCALQWADRNSSTVPSIRQSLSPDCGIGAYQGPPEIITANLTIKLQVIDPQSAVLTNIEVLAYLTANPPRRPPNPPPNLRHWVPSPDLRDHNTVVKEVHTLLKSIFTGTHTISYLQKNHETISLTPHQSTNSMSPRDRQREIHISQSQSQTDTPALPLIQSNAPTPMDIALRDLITQLQPYGLTKGEVLMIVNLGVGMQDAPAGAGEDGQEEEGEGEAGEGEGEVVNGNGDGMDVDVNGEGGAEGEGELGEEDYGALALLDTVIEEREERFSDEDVVAILGIIRGTLGRGQAMNGAG